MYIKDGIHYCRKCNTPREAEITFIGERKKVFTLCECMKEKQKQEEETYKQLDKIYQIKRNRLDGLRDDAYLDMLFDNSEEELTKEMKYCDNFEKLKQLNAGIMYFGAVGCGKTFRCGCIANRLIDNGYKVYMQNITALCNSLNAINDKQTEIDRICNTYDLLILDDMGAERKTEYMIELIYNIIDTRYRSKKPLIITSNLNLQELKKADDIRLQRTYDRLYEMCSFPITLENAGRRRNIANEKFTQIKAILE